jgi:hypothetical protein
LPTPRIPEGAIFQLSAPQFSSSRACILVSAWPKPSRAATRIGHNVRAFSPCGAKIAADFIDNPAQSPDTSCADRAAPIRFLPK